MSGGHTALWNISTESKIQNWKIVTVSLAEMKLFSSPGGLPGSLLRTKRYCYCTV